MGKLEALIKICKEIQGEDIGAILGFDKYKSISKVYEEKTKEQNYTQRDVESGYWINTLEEVVSREFMLRTKKKIRNYNIKSINKDCDFMVSNVNRKIVGENSILGCYVINGIDENDINDELFFKKYMIQAQHDMKVKNADKSYIAILINGKIFIMSEVKRDESLISKIVKAEEIFWKCNIENKVEPLKPLNLDTLD